MVFGVVSKSVVFFVERKQGNLALLEQGQGGAD